MVTSNENEHLDHLKQVFESFSEFGIALYTEKCFFRKSWTAYLDHECYVAEMLLFSDYMAAI